MELVKNVKLDELGKLVIEYATNEEVINWIVDELKKLGFTSRNPNAMKLNG